MILRQILLTSFLRNAWRTVRRICIFMSGLKGLSSSINKINNVEASYQIVIFILINSKLNRALIDTVHFSDGLYFHVNQACTYLLFKMELFHFLIWNIHEVNYLAMNLLLQTPSFNIINYILLYNNLESAM